MGRQKMNRDSMQTPELVKAISSRESLKESHVLTRKAEWKSSEVLGEQVNIQGLPQSTAIAPPSYSVFSTRRKNWTAWIMALASWFSPASSFIYFPAITSLAESLGVSISKINVTVTSYLVVSAVAPAIIGRAADESGRRPVLVVMLGLYVLANIGLALQHSYAALLLLRMLQSAGTSGWSYFATCAK